LKLEGETDIERLEEHRCGAGARNSTPRISWEFEDLLVLMRGGLAEIPEKVLDIL
jgi:hypothetical protein